MKKRLIAALVLLTLVIGLCGTIMASAETTYYTVGYAKVDINPYYNDDFEDYLQEKMPMYAGKYSTLKKTVTDAQGNIISYGDMMPLSLQGNSHTQERLTIGKQDDNGDGIVDENDGVFATCIAVTDPNGETVILYGTDMINGNENCVSYIRKVLFEKYGITGDRVMMDGSHNHHAPGYTGEAALKNSKNADDNAAYWLQVAWGEYLREKLIEAADIAMGDRQPAILSKGTIEAEESNAKNQPVGDTLNAIRKSNKENDTTGKYAEVEYVTVLEPAAPTRTTNYIEYYNYRNNKKTNSNGEEYWTGYDGYKHVITPDLFPKRQYNAVRHYLQTSEQVLHTPLWANTGLFRAYEFKKFSSDAAAAGYEGLGKGDYIPAKNGTEITYVAGDNCNGVVSPGDASAIKMIWITKGDGTINYTDDQIVPSSEQVKRAVTEADVAVADNGLTESDIGTIMPFKKDTNLRIYQFPDMYVASSVQHVSEVDDTMLVLKFDIIDEAYEDILLVNWRAHTNKNRTRSLDYKSEYTKIGFFESFYQITSDWINAFRYALEQEGYRVAYFSGASGNVNTSSRLESRGGWQSWKETAGKIKVIEKEDVNETITVNTATGTMDVYVTSEMVGYCYQTKYLGLDCNDSNIVTDATHLKNAAAIYGTELAEVALELLNGTNSKYKMQTIDNPTGGIRSAQSLYKTDRKSITVEEFLAAGIYHREDLQDSITNNKSGTATYTVGYWVDENGKPIVDKSGICSMLDENGNYVLRQDKDGNTVAGEYYTDDDLETYGYGQPVEWKTGKGTIASYLHANAAPKYYDSSASGTQVELNAILLCDQIALITAPGELYDRYGYTDDPNGEKIYWTEDGPVNINTYNGWESLWDAGTYGEPFFLGYCNNSTGYMPSRVTYDYSDRVENKAKGAYGVHTTSFAQGTGEDVMVELDWLLDQAANGGAGGTLTGNRSAYCEHCEKETTWVSLKAYIEEYVNAGHTTILGGGHYYVPENMTIEEMAVRNGSICLDLNGKKLLGEERVFNVAANGILNIQDSSKEKTGEMAGQGFNDWSTGSGTTKDPFRGEGGGTILLDGVLNLYSGTLTTKVTKEFKPGNGGVINVSSAGVLNMYGGSIANGVSGWAGGNIYSDVGSHLNLVGGNITGGDARIVGTECVNAKGTVCLQNDVKVTLLQLWPGDQNVAAQYADMLTVKGTYTGQTELSIKGAALAQPGLDIGTSDGAQYAVGALTVKENSDLVPAVDGNNLVLKDRSEFAEWYCEACKTTEHWKVLPKSTSQSLSGHYYLEEDMTVAQHSTGNAKVCLDLNGKTLKGNQRTFLVERGGTLNIQDSSAEKKGVMAGQGYTDASEPGGTVKVSKGSTLNLYSGTLTLMMLDGRLKPGNGGVVSTEGVFNMYGGTVRDGISGTVGGNIFVARCEPTDADKACFNMYGGTVSGGTCTNVTSTKSVVVRGYATLSGDAEVNRLSLFEHNVPLGDMLTIEGEYTGTTQIHLYNVDSDSIVDGLDIGNSDKAIIENADLTVFGSNLKVAVANETDDLVLEKPEVPKVAKVVTLGGEEQSFATLEEAAAQVDSPYEENNLFIIPEKLVLMANAEELTLNQNIVLDLNGYNVGQLNATNDATVYCMDSANVSEETVSGKKVVTYHADRCGVVAATDGKVVAVPSGAYKVGGSYNATYLFLAFTDENNKTTYHAADLDAKYQYLRPSESGMYFSAEFGGDTVVAGAVESFGIAMSTKGIPTAATMGTTALYTEMVNNEDHCFGETDLKNVQNILTNIMKTDISVSNNRIRAATKIYVRAYVKIDGKYYFGNRKIASLKSMIEKISTDYISDDGVISVLSNKQQEELLNMYEKYTNVMNYWNVDNLKVAAEKAKQ